MKKEKIIGRIFRCLVVFVGAIVPYIVGVVVAHLGEMKGSGYFIGEWTLGAATLLIIAVIIFVIINIVHWAWFGDNQNN